jgi:lipid-A-disaccharide synthase
MIFMVAGEASGDWVGALLAEALRRQRPGVSIAGIGGRRMAAAGVELFADSSGWGAIGVFEAASRVPRVWWALRATRRHLGKAPPDALVLIDCGAFNLPLARCARCAGIATLYYFPPGSWSRRLRSAELRELADVIATPFPWSRDLLAGGRARVEWVGHPVVEAARPTVSAEEAGRRYGLDANRPVVALAPGSRKQELRYVLPVLAGAGARLAAQVRDIHGRSCVKVRLSSSPRQRRGRRGRSLLHQDNALMQETPQFIVPVAATVDRLTVEKTLARFGVRATLLAGMEYNALQLADAAAVCSGTATLEFACLGIPMVAVYRASRATTLQYRLIRGLIGRQRFAAMPNIIAQRETVRELLGSAAAPEAVAAELAALLGDEERRTMMKRDLAEVAAALGQPGASDRTAALVLELAGRGKGRG